MRFFDDENGKKSEPNKVEVRWKDHWPYCDKCKLVDINLTATLSSACAHPGAALLAEELRKRQAPVVRQRALEEREWAKARKTFKIEKDSPLLVQNAMRYVGDK